VSVLVDLTVYLLVDADVILEIIILGWESLRFFSFLFFRMSAFFVHSACVLS